jgi:hypothetical protein
LLLDFAELSAIALLIEIRSNLSQPLWINSADLSHVFLACLNQFMIDHPLRAFVEERARGVNEDLLVVTQSFESLSWVFLSCMEEKPCTNRLSYLAKIFHVQSSTGNNWKLESVKNLG